ncbi:ABC transporter ATP-binding protein [Desulfothermus sp.]
MNIEVIIKILDLKKQYGRIFALNGINLKIFKGELFAYLGPNGAGKTTTIRILTGLTKKSSGEVWLNGYNIDTHSREAKSQFGLVPQSINLDMELSVKENLDIHGRLYGLGSKERKKRIEQVLEYVEMLDHINTLVKRLSGGMKRRVVIARALMHNPSILFLDEPTVGLDAKIRRRIWAIIKKIQQQGTTIFLTTHYIEEAEFLAQRVAFLDKGRIVTIDSPQKIIEKVGNWALDFLENNKLKTIYFKEREDAKKYILTHSGSFSLRRVNLEDAFLKLTGKKVQC